MSNDLKKFPAADLYAQFLQEGSAYARKYPQLRYGQAMFTKLMDMHNECASELLGTDADPYYNDMRIQAFLGKVFDYLIRTQEGK